MTKPQMGESRDHDPDRLARQTQVLGRLQRSIAWGHGHIAVLHFMSALKIGAGTTASQLAFCEETVRCSKDPVLKVLFDEVCADRGIALP